MKPFPAILLLALFALIAPGCSAKANPPGFSTPQELMRQLYTAMNTGDKNLWDRCYAPQSPAEREFTDCSYETFRNLNLFYRTLWTASAGRYKTKSELVKAFQAIKPVAGTYMPFAFPPFDEPEWVLTVIIQTNSPTRCSAFVPMMDGMEEEWKFRLLDGRWVRDNSAYGNATLVDLLQRCAETTRRWQEFLHRTDKKTDLQHIKNKIAKLSIM